MAAAASKLGLEMSIASTAFADCPRLAREAEERGYGSIWVPEVSGPDAFVTLATIAQATTKADLATGIVPFKLVQHCCAPSGTVLPEGADVQNGRRQLSRPGRTHALAARQR
jgi:hypothetical protein